jgi:hypothetical protein
MFQQQPAGNGVRRVPQQLTVLVSIPARFNAIRVHDEKVRARPGIFGDRRRGSVQANNPPTSQDREGLVSAKKISLHIADARQRDGPARQIKSGQSHNDSARTTACAAGPAEKKIELLIEVTLDVMAGRLRRSLSELTMAQSIDYAHESIRFPSFKKEGVAVFREVAAGARRGAKGQIAGYRTIRRFPQPTTAYNV